MAIFRSSPETFFVEELPAYLPSGSGEHTFLWIEKRGMTTPEAVKRLARALEVPDRDAGYAGMKDRHATTWQWISVPRVDPERAATIAGDDLRVVEAKRHGNKLRTGHLRGNRFEVVLTDVGAGEQEALEAAMARLARDGVPNRYGQQRFGAAGDNVQSGLAILRGERRERDGRKRRLLLSAVQSAVFNRVLALRAEAAAAGAGGAAGPLRRVLAGDVMQKVASGGLFVCDDVAREQARSEAGEIVPTGPMPGSRAEEPPPGSPARALEDRAFADVGVTREELASVGRDLPGTRRPLLIALTPGDPPVAAERGAAGGDLRVRLRFSLPAGAYATVVLDELGVRVPTNIAQRDEPPGMAGDMLRLPTPGER